MSLRTRVAALTPGPLRRTIGRTLRARATAAGERTADRIRTHVVSRTGNRVAAGPFAGLRYVTGASWMWSVPNLVGSYESELHAELELLLAARPRAVVDVGCAEGFYAVGMALRLPDATVYAYDIDARARQLCAEMAKINGVHYRLVIRGECTPAELDEVCGLDVLVILDCEGYEEDLLRPDLAPGLNLDPPCESVRSLVVIVLILAVFVLGMGVVMLPGGPALPR
jgi:hypothetical protein